MAPWRGEIPLGQQIFRFEKMEGESVEHSSSFLGEKKVENFLIKRLIESIKLALNQGALWLTGKYKNVRMQIALILALD